MGFTHRCPGRKCQEGRRNDAERLSRMELQVSALHQCGGSGGADRVVGELVKVGLLEGCWTPDWMIKMEKVKKRHEHANFLSKLQRMVVRCVGKSFQNDL